MLKSGVCALVLLSAGLAEVAQPPKAVEIGRAMMRAMGGQAAWGRVRFVRFDFNVTMGGQPMVSRSYLWDKQGGRCRVEDRAADGRQGVVLLSSLEKQQGAAYIAGQKLTGQPEERALRASHNSFLNDIMWLMMPWKWLEPGVNLKYAGRKTLNGQAYDVVEVTFEPPQHYAGDRYTAYVSPSSHLMERYEYVLRTGEKGAWDWQYGDTGGLKLARKHTNDSGAAIDMGDVRVLQKVDAAYWTDPNHWLSKLK